MSITDTTAPPVGGATAKEEGDEELIEAMLATMLRSGADFTNTFLNLCKEEIPNEALYASESFQSWHVRWQKRLGEEEQGLEASFALMRSVNPSVIPRNHKVEEALQAAEEGDFSRFHDLLGAVEKPYEDGEHLLNYQAPPQPSEQVLETFCGT